VLYLAYLGAFAIQDSALRACTEIRRAPQALLVGLPEHPSARAAVERALEAGVAEAPRLLDRSAPLGERLRARDAIVLGEPHFWSDLPRRLVELSFRADARSVADFRAAYPEANADWEADLDFLERIRNRFFFVIPTSMFGFMALLVFKTK